MIAQHTQHQAGNALIQGRMIPHHVHVLCFELNNSRHEWIADNIRCRRTRKFLPKLPACLYACVCASVVCESRIRINILSRPHVAKIYGLFYIGFSVHLSCRQ